MISDRLFRRYYPDDSKSGTRAFYDWVRRETTPETALLNLGAGPATGAAIRSFKGEVARVAGADIDPVVLENDELDEARLIVDGRLPFPDDHFDLIVSDWVFEHVEAPEPFLGEARRVLKSGGALFFRTPNRHHYAYLVSRFTSHGFHRFVYRHLMPRAEISAERRTQGPWRTFYRLNSAGDIRRHATAAGFGEPTLRFWEPEPGYLMFHPAPFLIGVAYERLVNRFDVLAKLRGTILGRLAK